MQWDNCCLDAGFMGNRNLRHLEGAKKITERNQLRFNRQTVETRLELH
jgi:hypothetical protein